jgi:stage III sporulation protein SpoIIIAA
MENQSSLDASTPIEALSNFSDAEEIPASTDGDRQTNDRKVHVTPSDELSTTIEHNSDQAVELLQREAREYLDQFPVSLRNTVKKYMPLLVEVRMDVGRRPHAVLIDGTQIKLSEEVVTQQQIAGLVKKIGRFDAENRAALDGSLHRFSQILNRGGKPIGMTLAYGRPLVGHVQLRVADVIAKAVQRHRSTVGILGVGGAGKTTHLRHAAFACGQFLGSSAVVIDTSGEVAGNGDVPHWSLGEARRFLVAHPDLQMKVMIEVVQNHRPRAMFVDEIGTTLEAKAAKTVKTRGCPLIFTVHADSLAALVNNDDLNLLTGGRRHVTVGDERADKRAGKKIEEERVTEPVADKAVLIIDFHTAIVFRDVAKAVDQILVGKEADIEVELISDERSGRFRDGGIYKLKQLREVFKV